MVANMISLLCYITWIILRSGQWSVLKCLGKRNLGYIHIPCNRELSTPLRDVSSVRHPPCRADGREALVFLCLGILLLDMTRESVLLKKMHALMLIVKAVRAVIGSQLTEQVKLSSCLFTSLCFREIFNSGTERIFLVVWFKKWQPYLLYTFRWIYLYVSFMCGF